MFISTFNINIFINENPTNHLKNLWCKYMYNKHPVSFLSYTKESIYHSGSTRDRKQCQFTNKTFHDLILLFCPLRSWNDKYCSSFCQYQKHFHMWNKGSFIIIILGFFQVAFSNLVQNTSCQWYCASFLVFISKLHRYLWCYQFDFCWWVFLLFLFSRFWSPHCVWDFITLRGVQTRT